MQPLMKRGSAVLMICAMLSVALLIVGFVLADRQSSVQAASATTVTLVSPKNARAGEPITVELIVTGARNLAGFQSAIGYDSEKVQLLDAVVTDGLRGSGRDVLQLGPVRGADTIAFGAVSCPVEDCVSSQYRSSGRKPQGVNGRVSLGHLIFEAPSPGRYELRLDSVKLVDPSGTVLPAEMTNMVLEVK